MTTMKEKFAERIARIPKYRNGPEVVRAARWDGRSKTITQFAPFENAKQPSELEVGGPLFLVSRDGTETTVGIGDWIIRDADGGVHGVKRDVFEATYEKVEE